MGSGCCFRNASCVFECNRPGSRQWSSRWFTVPADNERIISDSRVEVRYSPSVAGAMVDALPYLVDYPYGSTDAGSSPDQCHVR